MGERQTETKYRGDGTQTSHYIGAEKSDADIASAQATSRMSSVAGTGLGKKGGGFVPPKQNAGEDMSAYSERVRRARAEYGESSPKAEALRNVRKSLQK